MALLHIKNRREFVTLIKNLAYASTCRNGYDEAFDFVMKCWKDYRAKESYDNPHRTEGCHLFCSNSLMQNIEDGNNLGDDLCPKSS